MNFFSDYIKTQKYSHLKRTIALGALVVVVLVFLLGTLYLYSWRKEWDDKVAKIQAELDRAKAADLSSVLATENAKLAGNQRILDSLKLIDSAVGKIHFFTADNARTIIAAMPENVTIDNFIVNGVSLNIDGSLDSMATLASLIENLEETGLFVTVTPAGATLNYQGNESVEYYIECILKGGAL